MSRREENQTEKVTLDLPRNIMDFLRASVVNPEKYLRYTIIEGIKTDVDNQQVIIENLAEKYNFQ